MGYKIRYGPRIPAEKKRGSWQFIAVIVLAAAITLLCVDIWNGRQWLLPGDPQITAQALDTMVDSLRAGGSVGEAITCFCREIIENAAKP